jgi:CRISPR-associated RAMP protein (TIGR02581 family)
MTSRAKRQMGPDLVGFESRLELCGRLVLSTGLRVGAGRSEEVAATDLPVVKTVDDLPYIPGSSFKGAWRAFTETVLRTVQAQPEVQDHNLACLSASKGNERSPGDEPGCCLTAREVQDLKEAHRNDPTGLDRLLRERSCWTCRTFGAPWLASKVLVRDLPVVEGTFGRTMVRDGVTIDRDMGRVSGGLKYQFEAVPAGAEFAVEILVENGSEAELGLAWLGLRAMEGGMISLGGARSRGLGRCRFVPDWRRCRYVNSGGLISFLFEGETASEEEAVWRDRTMGWVEAFKEAIGIAEEARND